MRRISKNWLYIIFLSPLAISYDVVKNALENDWLFYTAAIAYICIASALASFLGRTDDN